MNLNWVFINNIVTRMTGVIPGGKATGILGLSFFSSTPILPVERLWHPVLLLLKNHLFPEIEEQVPRSRT